MVSVWKLTGNTDSHTNKFVYFLTETTWHSEANFVGLYGRWVWKETFDFNAKMLYSQTNHSKQTLKDKSKHTQTYIHIHQLC